MGELWHLYTFYNQIVLLTCVRPLIFLVKSLPWNDGLTLVQPEMGSYNEVPYTLYDPEKNGCWMIQYGAARSHFCWSYTTSVYIIPYKAIFCGDIPLHKPYISLIYGRYLQWIGSWNGHWYHHISSYTVNVENAVLPLLRFLGRSVPQPERRWESGDGISTSQLSSSQRGKVSVL